MRRSLPFSDLDVNETDIVEFDFSNLIADGAQASAPTCECRVFSGIDEVNGPTFVLVGAPAMTLDGLKVRHAVRGCVAGVTYRIRCRAIIAGLAHVLTGTIVCVRL